MTPSWKQKNPKDQMTAIVRAMEGHIDNCLSGVIDVTQLHQKIEPLIEQLKEMKRLSSS